MNKFENEIGVIYPKGISMSVIILLLIFFYPAGIILMISKLHKEKGSFRENAKNTTTIGWVFTWIGIAFGVLMAIVTATSPELTEEVIDVVAVIITVMVMLLPLIIPGVYMIKQGKKYKNMGELYFKYIPTFTNNSDGYLDKMVNSTGLSYDMVEKDLNDLIGVGVFPGGYIDSNSRRIVWNKNNTSRNMYGSKKMEIEPKKCKNCGGVNPPTAKECQYCETPL